LGETKVCTQCRIEKPATTEYFSKQTIGKNGLQPACKECCKRYREANKDKIVQHNKEYRETNKDKIAQQHKQWREANKEHIAQHRRVNIEHIAQYLETHKEHIAQRNKEHYELIKEHQRAYGKEYQKLNKEHIAQHKKQWSQSNPDKCIAAKQRRRAYKADLPANFTAEQWETAKEHFNNVCAYCGVQVPLTQDHVVPLSKGGAYTHDNIIPACSKCNSSKRSREFKEWYHKQPFYSKRREQTIINYLNGEYHGTQISFEAEA